MTSVTPIAATRTVVAGNSAFRPVRMLGSLTWDGFFSLIFDERNSQ